MPSRMNRLPIGIANLLDIKSQGVGLNDLLEEVRGTIDLTQFYFIGSERGINASNNMSAVGFTGGGTDSTVPSGEYWLVTEYAVSATCAAGETIRIQPAFLEYLPYISAASGAFTIALAPPVSAVAGETIHVPAINAPFILRPASVLKAIVNQITTAGNIAVNCSGRAYRLR